MLASTSTPQRGSPRAIRSGSQSAREVIPGFHGEEEGIQRSSPGSRNRAQEKERASLGAVPGAAAGEGMWARR